MDNKRIGINKDLAIIVKRNKNEFNATKIVIGHYIFENNIFVSEDGTPYKHLTDYDNTSAEDKYFIGSISLTDKYLNKRNDNIELSYLEEYQRYTFKLSEGKIICKDIYTNEKFYYRDLVTMIRKAVEESLNDILKQLMPSEQPEEEPEEPIEFNQSLQEITTNLKKNLKSNDEAATLLAERIYEKYHFDGQMDSNILLIVPSENEKISVTNALKQSINLPILKLKIPDIPNDNYINNPGDKKLDENTLVVDMLNSNRESTDNIENVRNSIVIIESLEKLSIFSQEKENESFVKSIQQLLVKIITGVTAPITKNDEVIEYNTSNNFFIGIFDLQSWQKMKQKNSALGFNDTKQNQESNYELGLTNQLINKLPNVIKLNQSTAQEIYDIILNDENSIIVKMKKIFSEQYGIEIKNLESIVQKISYDIVMKKLSAKDSIQIIQKMFEVIKHQIYENPDQYNELILGDNILNDNNDFILRKRRSKTRKKVTE